VVVVQSPAIEISTAYAARLAGVLRNGPLATARISYRLDAAHLKGRALLYLPVDRLRDILDTVAVQEDLLTNFATRPTLDRLVAGINQSVGSGFLPAVLGPGSAHETNVASMGLLRELVSGMTERLDGGPYRSPWATLVRAPGITPDDDHYFLSRDGRLL